MVAIPVAGIQKEPQEKIAESVKAKTAIISFSNK